MKVFPIIKKQLWEYKKVCFLYLALAIISCLITVAIPYFSGNFIDMLVYMKEISSLYQYIIILALLHVMSIISGYFKDVSYNHAYSRIANGMCLDVIRYIQRLHLSFFQHNTSVYLTERITKDSTALISFINEFLNLLIQILIFISSLVILLQTSSKITLILFLIFPFYILLYNVFKKKLYELKRTFIEKDNSFMASLNEQISRISFIKLNAIYDYMHKKIRFIFDDFFSHLIRFTKVFYLYQQSSNFFTKVATIIVYIFGGIEIFQGNLTIGEFSIINLYFGLSFGAIQYFIGFGEKYQSALISYNRIIEFLDNPQENNGQIKIEDISTIKLNNISFSYHKDNDLLKKFSYEFRRGLIYCIKGSNGSGKSTLVKLMLGLEEDYKGEIYYNSIDLRELNSYDLKRNLIGITEQEPSLLPDTLRNNLVLDNPNIQDKQIIDLCKQFELDNLLHKLPMGLDTVIDENNSTISGGEKQKLSILRTLLKDPNIIILDEPSSALDDASIKKLKKLLFQQKANKIIILISHDEKILSFVDHIVDIKKNMCQDQSY